jgi:hypothetical protein
MPKQHSEPPDLKTIGGRIRWAREQYVTPEGGRLTSPRAAAKFFGWKSEDTTKSHESGARQSKQLKLEHAEKYARAYGVTVEWILTGRGNPYRRTA